WAFDDGRLVADVDGHATGPALLGLGDSHLENTVGEARLDAFRIDPFRQRERARKRPPGALEPLVAVMLRPMLWLALARDREHVVLELDVDGVLLDAGQIGAQDEVLVFLEEI